MLKGSVSNLRNGDVELFIEDSENIAGKLEALLSDLKNNPCGYSFYGKIDEITVQDFRGRVFGDYSF